MLTKLPKLPTLKPSKYKSSLHRQQFNKYKEDNAPVELSIEIDLAGVWTASGVWN
jgi:hypothetical protein